MRRCCLTLLAAAVLCACSPTSHSAILHALRTQLARQYHECVPLGWDPVPAAGSFYPGYSAEFEQTGVWLKSYWIGYVGKRDLGRPDVRVAAAILNELVRDGLLERTRWQSGSFYHLTLRALPYYYEDNAYGDNPEHMPYLCYSGITPNRVLWNSLIQHGSFHAAFEWRAATRASWAQNDFLRAHSVILPPVDSPVLVTFANVDGGWNITRLNAPHMLPRVVDVNVWPRQSSAALRQAQDDKPFDKLRMTRE
jgi:hypothetical protein